MNEPKPLPSETKLVERLNEDAEWNWISEDNAGFSAELISNLQHTATLEREAAAALASLADELRLAREALKGAAEMLQASLPYWQTDERGNGPDCTPMLQAILNANAALKEPR